MSNRRFSFRPRPLILNAAVCGIILAMCAALGVRYQASADATNKKMPETKFDNSKFYDALEKSLARRGRKIADVCRRDDAVLQRILNDYGAVFLAEMSVAAPPVCMFETPEAVDDFQKQTEIASAEINGTTIELQSAAMRALLAARAEAQGKKLDITPRDGAEAARRGFDDTLRLWDSRFIPALAHWAGKKRITATEAERLKNLPLREQIAEVLRLEEQKIFFSKDFSKSILYSVAAPGCSQHLSLLAFDANEFQNKKVRKILARHGWFRTVQNDLPHFTFLGRDEDDLPALGLKKLETGDGEFWIPDV